MRHPGRMVPVQHPPEAILGLVRTLAKRHAAEDHAREQAARAAETRDPET